MDKQQQYTPRPPGRPKIALKEPLMRGPRQPKPYQRSTSTIATSTNFIHHLEMNPNQPSTSSAMPSNIPQTAQPILIKPNYQPQPALNQNPYFTQNITDMTPKITDQQDPQPSYSENHNRINAQQRILFPNQQGYFIVKNSQNEQYTLPANAVQFQSPTKSTTEQYLPNPYPSPYQNLQMQQPNVQQILFISNPGQNEHLKLLSMPPNQPYQMYYPQSCYMQNYQDMNFAMPHIKTSELPKPVEIVSNPIHVQFSNPEPMTVSNPEPVTISNPEPVARSIPEPVPISNPEPVKIAEAPKTPPLQEDAPDDSADKLSPTKRLPEAKIKPSVLTHIINGHVIKEYPNREAMVEENKFQKGKSEAVLQIAQVPTVVEEKLPEVKIVKEVKQHPVAQWSVKQVCDRLKTFPSTSKYVDDFCNHDIDGESLLLIKPEHLMSVMSVNLGTALKMVRDIDLLRNNNE